MGIIFMDGFDHYDGPLSAEKWTGGTADTPSATGRYGGQSLEYNPGQYVSLNFSPYGLTWASFSVQFKTPDGVEPYNLIEFVDDVTVQVKVYVGGGKIVVDDGSASNIGREDFTPTLDEWYYFEIKATFSGGVSTGEFVISIDGVEVLNLSSGNTAGSGNSVADSCRVGNVSAGSPFWMDDFCLRDDGGGAFLGPTRIIRLDPTTNAYADWACSTGSDHVALVDEVLADTADYLFTETAPADDLFYLQDIADLGVLDPTVTSYLGVQAVAYVKADLTGWESEIRLDVGGSITPVPHEPSTAWRFYYLPSELNFTTVLPWTESDLNSLFAGYKANDMTGGGGGEILQVAQFLVELLVDAGSPAPGGGGLVNYGGVGLWAFQTS